MANFAPRVLVASALLTLSTLAAAAPDAPKDPKKKPPAPSAAAATQTPAPDGTPIAVLVFDEEGFEEQAEAITLALRARLRLLGGWSVRDDVPSFALLSASNRCGPEIDLACQTKIADQLKLDYFVWGRLDRQNKGNMTATMHLFRRSGAVTETKESYSENLKEQNDDVLRQIAQRSIDKLLGRSVGRLVVNAPGPVGTVIVDNKRYALDRGRVTLELTPGAHRVEVLVRGFATQTRELTVPASEQIAYDVPAVRDDNATGLASNETPLPTRTILGAGLIVVGGAALIGGTYFAVNYFDENSKATAGREKIPPPNDVCDPKYEIAMTPGAADAVDACKHARSANRSWPWAWVLGAVGVAGVGAGVYVLVTNPAKEKPVAGAKSIRVTPIISREPGFSLTGRF